MPIYEYVCPNRVCGKKEERLVSFVEADNQVCSCGVKFNRLISPCRVKLGASFINNFRDDDVDESGKPYKGFYYDEEYCEKQDEQGVPLV